MAEYDNRNRFTLFRNNRKRDGKKDADFNGTFTDEGGREYWINAWSTKPNNGGEKFLSGSVRLKENKVDAPPKVEGRAVDLNDEVPFAPEFR
jgi:hypothetical protein